MKVILFFLLFLLCAHNNFCIAESRQIPFVIHVHSTYSDNGVMSIEEIAETARKNGIKAVIFNDHDIMKWEYGIWPLRNIIKRNEERFSVLSAGPKRYLDHIEEVNKKYDDLVLIPGIESSPFYYWAGGLLDNTLTLKNWHKHLLIVGLDKPEQYLSLPLLGNEIDAGEFRFFLMWPLLIIGVACIIFIRNRKTAILLLITGIIFTANNFPFITFDYNQYSGDQGEKPYQRLIDYVNKTAPETGMIFWAHPEAPNYEILKKTGKIFIKTPRYPDSLLNTYNYTGFGYFQEGQNKAGSPGGNWDKVLIEYINGKRKTPVWAVAELDYRKEGLHGTYIGSFKNILVPPDNFIFSKQNLLKHIKAGNFYIKSVKKDSYEVILDKFELTGKGNFFSMGKTSPNNEDLRLFIALSTTDKQEHHKVSVKIIQNAEIVKSFERNTPFTAYIEDFKNTNNSYVRIEIEADNGTKILTNPIFTLKPRLKR